MGQKLYANGIILTMEKQMYAEAVLVKDGRIAAVGRKAAVEAQHPATIGNMRHR